MCGEVSVETHYEGHYTFENPFFRDIIDKGRYDNESVSGIVSMISYGLEFQDLVEYDIVCFYVKMTLQIAKS